MRAASLTVALPSLGVVMNDCILWVGAVSSTGYGNIGRKRDGIKKYFGAHRVAWAEANGWDYWDLTPDMVVRHVCDVKLCVNPDHLVLGTQSDNMRDAVDKGRLWQQKVTHCPQGHEYSDKNTYIYKGGRYCRACRNEQQQLRRWFARA